MGPSWVAAGHCANAQSAQRPQQLHDGLPRSGDAGYWRVGAGPRRAFGKGFSQLITSELGAMRRSDQLWSVGTWALRSDLPPAALSSTLVKLWRSGLRARIRRSRNRDLNPNLNTEPEANL